MFFFSKNKKKKLLIFLLVFFIFSGAIFAFTDVQVVSAGYMDCNGVLGYLNAGCYSPVRAATGVVGDTIVSGIQRLIYAVFLLFGVLVSVAITIFEWAINPKYISGDGGLLNLQAVYDMWAFIRDFFNLFFILVLLYIAFTVVFQIQKNFKQALLSLVLAALLINFSFPISRFMIDATNVPMYFFTNQMMAGPGTGKIFGSALSASRLQGILIPGSEKGGTVNFQDVSIMRLLMATIFMFLFSITLLVLAVMFVIRLIVLMVLVIFSSAGFAASIVPGMEQYSKMWWDNFWKYALFGPAAMLMLLIATGFFAVIGNEEGAMFRAMRNVAGDIATKNDTNFVASMVMFSIPIILLWMTIGLGQTMAIAGGATISGYGHKFAAWAGKKFSGYSALKRNIDSYSAARKKRTDEKNKDNWGGSLGKYWNKTQDQIYGRTHLPGSGAALRRTGDMHNKEVYEQVDENKKLGLSESELKNQLAGADKVKAAAAAISLSAQGDINSFQDFNTALQALGGNTKEVSNLIAKADFDAMGMTADQRKQALSSDAFKNRDGSINEKFEKQLDKRLVETGQAKILVDNLEQYGDKKGNKMTRKDAVAKVLSDIGSAKDKVKQRSLFKDYEAEASTYVNSLHTREREELEKVAAQESHDVHNVLSRVPSASSSNKKSAMNMSNIKEAEEHNARIREEYKKTTV